MRAQLLERIQSYLGNGGFFNPEMMEHEKVRDLIMDCRTELESMNAMSPEPKDSPLMKAWEDYKMTEDYANTRNWATHRQHVDGSLWAAFVRGWKAAKNSADVK